MSVSPNIVIMTRVELTEAEARSFARGVERGKFEERANGTRDAVIEDAAKAIDALPVSFDHLDPEHAAANALLDAARAVRAMKGKETE